MWTFLLNMDKIQTIIVVIKSTQVQVVQAWGKSLKKQSFSDICHYSRDAKTYERANNVCVKKILYRVNSLKNFTLFCQESEYCRACEIFGRICWHIFFLFMLLFCIFCTIWVFWAFYAVLSPIRYVVIYSLFWVNIFWLKPCSCKKLSFCISGLFVARQGRLFESKTPQKFKRI